MTNTFCNSGAVPPDATDDRDGEEGVGIGRPRRPGPRPAAAPWAPTVRRGAAADGPARPAGETRAYFRCDRLDATLSVQQCRANRERLSPHEALALPFDLPPWWVQPLPCWSCTLAPQVEAAQVPFYSAEQVLAGHARAAAVSSHQRPQLH